MKEPTPAPTYARGEQIRLSIGYSIVPRLIETLSTFGRFFQEQRNEALGAIRGLHFSGCRYPTSLRPRFGMATWRLSTNTCFLFAAPGSVSFGVIDSTATVQSGKPG